MIKIGIDIVAITRIQKIYNKHSQKFLERFLSQEEILLTRNNIQTIAGFWAAKEACSKAIGTGIGAELGFLDIHIGKNSKNAPMIHLQKDKKLALGFQDFSLSITHDGNFAIAVVIAK
ncbi:holo-ACP synthase [Helicobacter anatolicus]|uniref:holo-ACP synthase n=1 Tax=Helicobacter anatolicus TaxID=2905874 RepID=UPI001E36ECAC|nr:holo-ACP synthase [Helicobacter anatolicus]MCE3039267.1 holo-ACP synthase [Helicobacter anatolicus]